MGVTDNYVSFFLSFPKPFLWEMFLLSMARIAPIVAIVPFFGGKTLPDSAKLGLIFVLAPIFLPYILVHSSGPIPFDLIYLMLMVKEVMVGFFLAILISVPFYYMQGAGTLIDHQRGVQSLQVMDPSSSTQVSPTGMVYNNVFMVIFFLLGGPLLFFEALFTSYAIMPADTFLSASFFSSDQPLWNVFIRTFNTILTMSLQLSAPALITILMSDLFLGITNRMAPQVQITFLLWSLKAFLGVAILWAAWWFILQQMDILAISWVKYLFKLIKELGHFLQPA